MTIKKEDVAAMLEFLLPESGMVDQTALETASLLTSSKMRNEFRTRVLRRLFNKIYENLSDFYKSADWVWQVESADIRNCSCSLRHNNWPKGLKVAFENWREELCFGVISPSILVSEKYRIGAEILPAATRDKINKYMNADPKKSVLIWSLSPHWPAWSAYHYICRSDGIPEDDLIYSDFLVNENEHATRIAKYLDITLTLVILYFNSDGEAIAK